MGDVVLEDETWVVANYVVVAASTLWIADFIETLPTEVDTIWLRKFTGTSTLFLLNRYMLLLGLIFQALMTLPGNGTNKQCQGINLSYSLLQCLTFAITNLLFALRIYAIYQKNRMIFGISLTMIILMLIFLVLIVALKPGISTVGSPYQGFSRCRLDLENELPLNRLQTGIPFVVLGYDLFIFVLTVKKTIHHAINMRRLCPGQSSVTQIIIRDGTLYFIATLVLAAIDVVLLLTSLKSPGDTNSLSEVVGPFFNVFSNLLISRLMLNLHTFNTSGNIMMNRGVASIQSSSLHFAPIAFGAPLDVTDGAVEEMEMERQ